MDVRDLDAWSKEARRKVLLRRQEAYAASLLPHQEADAMQRMLDDLGMEMYEIDHGDEISEIDAKARQRLEAMKKRRRDAK